MAGLNGSSSVARDAVTMVMALNASSTSGDGFVCRQQAPTSAQLFYNMPSWASALLAFICFCFVANLGVFFEAVVFLVRTFPPGPRLTRTLWILSFFPGFALTSFIAVLVPRSGTLCTLVSNVFFVSCLHQFVGLMEDYLGGPVAMWGVLGECRQISINTPPCCCCCVCLPKVALHKRNYQRLTWLVVQVTIIRTILAFIAAVLWTNGSYIPGYMAPDNAFLYIAIINLLSTMVAMWALMILKAATRADLEERFSLGGKFACIQLSIISIAVSNIVIGLLVTFDVIKCTQFYPSKARAEAIFHGVVVIMMFLFGLVARHYFRRPADAWGLDQQHAQDTFVSVNADSLQVEVNGNSKATSSA